jgi:hypothetical protein
MLGPLFARGLGSVMWVAAAAAGAGTMPHAFGPPGLAVGLVGAPPPLPGVLFVPASPSPQAAPMTVQVVVQPIIQSPASPQTIPAPAGGPQGPTSSFPTGGGSTGSQSFGFAAPAQ